MKKTTSRRLVLQRDIVKTLSVNLRHVAGGTWAMPTPGSNCCTCNPVCPSQSGSGCSECTDCPLELT